MAKMSVIVLAAGSGQRFGGKENKVLAKLDGQPLFLRALQLFVNRDDVCQTILVVSPREIDQFKEQFGPNIGFMGAEIAEGGAERHESVANGLARVSDEAELVAVHDAVRVCVADRWIDAIAEAAAKSGAAVPVIPVSATLKRLGDDRIITDTVDREGLFMAQTPQVFRKDVLASAYAKLGDNGLDVSGPFTDDAQVVSAAGTPVTAVDGDPRNIKITTRADLSLAGAIIKTLPQKKAEKFGAFEEAQW